MARRGSTQDSVTKVSKSESSRILKRLLVYLKPYRIHLIFFVALAIITSVIDIVSPMIMGETINYVLGAISENNFIRTEFIGYIKILGGIYITHGIFSYLWQYMGVRLSTNIIYSLRRDVSAKIKKLPMSYFDKHSTGDLLSRMTNDIQTIANSLEQLINNFLASLITIIGIMGIMIYINPYLTIIVLLVIPITAASAYAIIQKAQEEFRLQWDFLGDLNGYIEEMYSSIELIKSYNYQDMAREDFDSYNNNFINTSRRAEFISGILMPVSFGINNISMAIISVGGGILVILGRLTVGGFQAFVQYARRFTRPISNMADVMSIIQSGVAAARRVFNLIDEEEMIEDPENPLSLKGVESSVDIENLYFGYDEDKLVLKDINLHVKPGESVAIVGSTGSGKTTLINLLVRFYEANKGKILIGGIDITQVSRSELKDYIGMVLQDTWLFKGTVEENISYGSTDCTRDDVIKAAKYVNAHQFIERLPEGYDTVIEEGGSNISQGEKQLLTIARALVSNPEILILDEATSSVDTRTEALIQEGIRELTTGRTSFLIAHRLSTIVGADVILVMDDGRIVERGSHEELLEKDGYYKELYMSQF